jgi:ribosomal protein S27E
VKEFMAQKIIERVQAHYESREVPFGKTYKWHSSFVALECECGEKVTLSATSTMTTCRQCGADLGAIVHDIQEEEREGHSPDKLTHPWFYDAKERAQQHQHDEAAYPKGSPWRYNDITGDP